MSQNLIGFIFAVISAIALGTGTFFYKISSRSLGAGHTTFFYYLFSTLMVFAVWIFISSKEPVNRTALIWPGLMAFFLCISVWTFSSAVRSIDISTASTIRGLSFLPSVVLAFIFYGERLTPRGLIAIFLVTIAVILLGTEGSESVDKQVRMDELKQK